LIGFIFKPKTMFTVYVLHSEKYGKIYIGYTSNLQERLKSHNELGKKGWTVKFRPWTLVCSSMHAALVALNKERNPSDGPRAASQTGQVGQSVLLSYVCPAAQTFIRFIRT